MCDDRRAELGARHLVLISIFFFSGQISSRGPGTDGARRQHDALIEEGVEVTQAAGGGHYRVKLSTYGWFPDTVEAADISESEHEA